MAPRTPVGGLGRAQAARCATSRSALTQVSVVDDKPPGTQERRSQARARGRVLRPVPSRISAQIDADRTVSTSRHQPSLGLVGVCAVFAKVRGRTGRTRSGRRWVARRARRTHRRPSCRRCTSVLPESCGQRVGHRPEHGRRVGVGWVGWAGAVGAFLLVAPGGQPSESTAFSAVDRAAVCMSTSPPVERPMAPMRSRSRPGAREGRRSRHRHPCHRSSRALPGRLRSLGMPSHSQGPAREKYALQASWGAFRRPRRVRFVANAASDRRPTRPRRRAAPQRQTLLRR
jgi:hypothetical protein